MIKVFIIDDHPIVRKGIRETVAEAPDLSVAGEASTGEEGLAWLRDNRADIVLLDLSLPGIHGLEVLDRLNATPKAPPVLILTMHAEEQYAARVLKKGAAGFLLKDSPPEQLLAALRKIASGGRFVTPALAEKLLFRREEQDRPLHEALSNREFLVMKMIGAGRAPREIGETLNISVKTVSTYRSRILHKLGLKSGADLIRYCLDHKLLEDQS